MGNDNQKLKLWILLFVAVTLSILIFVQCQKCNDIAQSTSTQAETISNYTWMGDNDAGEHLENDTIFIPGITQLTFNHDSDKQQVPFYNPSENTAIMKIKLLLDDGTKLWESNELKPGDPINTITINNMPSVGRYHAMLVVDCKDQNGNALNGGIINITLYIE